MREHLYNWPLPWHPPRLTHPQPYVCHTCSICPSRQDFWIGLVTFYFRITYIVILTFYFFIFHLHLYVLHTMVIWTYFLLLYVISLWYYTDLNKIYIRYLSNQFPSLIYLNILLQWVLFSDFFFQIIVKNCFHIMAVKEKFVLKWENFSPTVTSSFQVRHLELAQWTLNRSFFLVILMRDFSVLSADDTATKQVYEGGRGMCERVREVVYRRDAV